MSKSKTTNRPYYFARRKDTGMAGVWFTHCATERQQLCVIDRLIDTACQKQDMVIIPPACAASLGWGRSRSWPDARFRVAFLEDNFVKVVKEYVKVTGESIIFDLTLKVTQESNLENKRLP